MKKIDMENWERKSHFEWFSSFADPSLAVDVKIKITPVLRECKKRQLSSFAILMYIFTEAVNSNRAFRLRMLGGDVVEIDSGNAAYTFMVNDCTYVNCRATCGKGLRQFLFEVGENTKRLKNSNYVQQQYNDISIVDDVYVSCLPWVNFSSVKQPVPDHIPESKSIPRICWGKYFEENGDMFTTLNITANHALVDGIDVTRVIEKIEKTVDNIEKLLGEL